MNIKALLLGLLTACGLWAQQATPVSNPVTYLPKLIVTGGGGYVTNHGSFSYASESNYLGQSMYSTVAQEYTLDKARHVTSCTVAGITRPLQQLGPLVIGITGLGGGCSSTSGSSGGAWSAQGFADVRFGKSNYGMTLTASTSQDHDVKISLGLRIAK